MKIWIGVGYSRDEIPGTHGTVRLKDATQLSSLIQPAVTAAYEATAVRTVPIRRLAISFLDTCDEGCEGYDLFTDWNQIEREKTLERTVLEIRSRYGKNAVLRGINLDKAGTQKERNEMIGGHRAGYDDERAARQTVHAV